MRARTSNSNSGWTETEHLKIIFVSVIFFTIYTTLNGLLHANVFYLYIVLTYSLLLFTEWAIQSEEPKKWTKHIESWCCCTCASNIFKLCEKLDNIAHVYTKTYKIWCKYIMFFRSVCDSCNPCYIEVHVY